MLVTGEAGSTRTIPALWESSGSAGSTHSSAGITTSPPEATYSSMRVTAVSTVSWGPAFSYRSMPTVSQGSGSSGRATFGSHRVFGSMSTIVAPGYSVSSAGWPISTSAGSAAYVGGSS